MSADRLWWVALVAIAITVGLAIVTGPTYLTTAAALLTTGLVILAVIADAPPTASRNDRRPW